MLYGSSWYRYDTRHQPPFLLVLSSATDLPRRICFPLGRTLDTLYRAPFRSGQRAQWTEALGEYVPQRTHAVDIVAPNGVAPPQFDPGLYTSNPCAIVNYDLTDIPFIAGVKLQPTSAHPHPFSPFIVAYASGEVVIRHTGIWEALLLNFLTDYSAIAEGKRMLLSDPRSNQCPAAPIPTPDNARP